MILMMIYIGVHAVGGSIAIFLFMLIRFPHTNAETY